MYRGGRGGRGGGGAGSMGGQMLPFEVDVALESEINAYKDREAQDEADEWTKQLYPPMRIFVQPPPSAYERRLLQKRREHRVAMRNGPFFVDAPTTGKREASSFNAFEDQATYGNRRAKRRRGLPNLKEVPIVKELLPPELWDVLGDTDAASVNGKAPKKNLAWLKKKRIDKLAQFDEGADADAMANADDDEDEQPKNDENEGEDDVGEPQDDDFSEDDDDLGNDYNAEKYFDDGDGADDDGGGDDGGEDAW